MPDPAFNDFYYVPQPALVVGAGLHDYVEFGGPDFDPTGIVIAFGSGTLAGGIDDWTEL